MVAALWADLMALPPLERALWIAGLLPLPLAAAAAVGFLIGALREIAERRRRGGDDD